MDRIEREREKPALYVHCCYYYYHRLTSCKLTYIYIYFLCSCSPHGIFHLSDPGGVSVIRNCQQRGFHPHEEPEDGSPLYEHCSHVFMNAKLQFDVVDLRWACNLLTYTKAFLLIIYSEKEITSTVNFSAADSDVN